MSLLSSSSSSSPSSFAFPSSSVSAAEELPLAHGFPSHPIHLHSLKNDLPFADDLLSNDYSEEEQFTPLFPPLPSSMGMAYPRFPQSFKDNAAFAFPRLPLPPATSQPRFSQSSIPSSTKCEVYTHPQSSSSSQVLPNQKPVKRVGGAEPRRGSRSHPPLPSFYVSQPTRTPSPNKARFVSPLSIEPQQKHLTRRKVEESNLCSFPESMVIPSSSNGHCYMVEDLFPSPHVSQEEFEEESESFEELFSDSSRIGASTFSSESDESDSTDPIFSTSPSLHPSTGSPIERLHRLEKLF